MTDGTSLLRIEGVTKRYGGVIALDGVSLTLERGEVRAVVGKNGAGKSTLVNVLCGAVQPDAGSIVLDGSPVRFGGPLDARRVGIVTVHQETHVVPDLTVADNIMLGRWPVRRGAVDRRATVERAREQLERLRSDLRPEQSCAHLSIASWQIIEIARALAQELRVLVLDEPTSALSTRDADVLLGAVRALADEGVGVIYISHRLDELRRLADRLTIVREGSVVGDLDAKTTAPREMIELMVGSAARAAARAPKARPQATQTAAVPALSATGMHVPDRLFGVDIELARGEILGLAGLVGAGRSELLQSICGAIEAEGVVRVAGKLMRRRSPSRLRRAGVAMVSDDRKREGLFPDMSVADNISLGNLQPISRWGVISRHARVHAADEAIESLGIKAGSREQPVVSLSGGNQQKVVIARALGGGTRVLLLDEPTRGVDVDAKFQIYELLRRLRDSGLSILVAPSEFDEFPLICDRVLVLRAGRIVASVDGATNPSQLMALAIGEVRGDAPHTPQPLGALEASV